MKPIILLLLSFIIILIDSCQPSNKEQINDNVYEELLSQYGADSTDIWGQGIISNSILDRGETINFPDSIVHIYNKPYGEIIGTIYREKGNYYNLLCEIYINKTIKKTNKKDNIEVSYEGQNLKFYKKDKDYYQCLIHSFDGGIWLSKVELEKFGFSMVNWETFLKKNFNKEFHPTSSDDIVLLDSTMNVIDTLTRGENVIVLLNENYGRLTKVDIYKESFCVSGNRKKTGSAWLEIIDKNGHPRIFFSPRGC